MIYFKASESVSKNYLFFPIGNLNPFLHSVSSYLPKSLFKSSLYRTSFRLKRKHVQRIRPALGFVFAHGLDWLDYQAATEDAQLGGKGVKERAKIRSAGRVTRESCRGKEREYWGEPSVKEMYMEVVWTSSEQERADYTFRSCGQNHGQVEATPLNIKLHRL